MCGGSANSDGGSDGGNNEGNTTNISDRDMQNIENKYGDNLSKEERIIGNALDKSGHSPDEITEFRNATSNDLLNKTGKEELIKDINNITRELEKEGYKNDGTFKYSEKTGYKDYTKITYTRIMGKGDEVIPITGSYEKTK